MPQRKNEVLIEWMGESMTPVGWTAAMSPLYGCFMPYPLSFRVPGATPPRSLPFMSVPRAYETSFVVFTSHGSRVPLMVKTSAFLWQEFAQMLNLLIRDS